MLSAIESARVRLCLRACVLLQLLSLVLITHIASLFELDGELDPVYLVVATLLTLVPMVTLVALKVKDSREMKAADKASQAARGTEAVRSAASKFCSKFCSKDRAKTTVEQQDTVAPAVQHKNDATSSSTSVGALHAKADQVLPTRSWRPQLRVVYPTHWCKIRSTPI